jgi:hypothetical protein
LARSASTLHGGWVFCRRWRGGADGKRNGLLAALPAAEHASPAILDHLTHEYDSQDELGDAWAVRPLELVREHG